MITDDAIKQFREYSEHLSRLCGIPCIVLDVSECRYIPGFCGGCTYSRCSKNNTHKYGCNEAYRWGGKYIYHCPLGLAFAASSICDDAGVLIGGIVAGPMVIGDLQDALDELADKSMREDVSKIPQISTVRARDLVEVMAVATISLSGAPPYKAIQLAVGQEELMNAIYEMKDRFSTRDDNTKYIIDSEKKLHELIEAHDKAGTREMLNDLLGCIFFSSDFDIDQIKARTLELLVILSRAAIEAGAELNEILLFNTSYIKDIEKIKSIEDLSGWITGVIHRFINYTFDFTEVKYSNAVYKAMEFVRSNYDKKISLDDIANYVYLSRTYLSSVFKQETGQSLFKYINHVRIEKSKRFLASSSKQLVEIADLCGFEDQSYFTKVFKRDVGVSPKKYRDNNRAGSNN